MATAQVFPILSTAVGSAVADVSLSTNSTRAFPARVLLGSRTCMTASTGAFTSIEPVTRWTRVGVATLTSCEYAEETHTTTARKAAAARADRDRNISILGLRLRWTGG